MLRTLRGRVDGLIVMSPTSAWGRSRGALPADTPVALLNTAASRPADDSHRQLRRRAGHDGAPPRDSGIGGSPSSPGRSETPTRRSGGGAIATLCKGAAFAPSEVAGDFTEDSGYRPWPPSLLKAGQRPTAIFAANDAMAIGALRALREAQLRVPEEIALAGFDDIPIARYLTPPLTTVRVEIGEMARRAVDYLVDTLESGSRRAAENTTSSRPRSSSASPAVRRLGGGRIESERTTRSIRNRRGGP